MIIENKSPEFQREQSPERIIELLTEAIEGGKDVELTQLRTNGEATINIAEPVSIDGNYLTIEAGGYGFDIELAQIVNVEIVV